MRTSVASEHRLNRPVSREWWIIAISGYGKFGFYGSEGEAEEMRAHKAEWEGSVGTKERATIESSEVQEQIRWVRDVELPHGYPRVSERERAETAAVLAANRLIQAPA